MKEILLTSSVMILLITLLRFLFRGKVSRRLMYGVWLLAALRLLIPFQFGSLDFSILSSAEPVSQVITEVAQNPVAGPSRTEIYEQIADEYLSRGEDIRLPEVQTEIEKTVEDSIMVPTVGEVLTGIWIAGMAAIAIWFLLVNLSFSRKLPCSATPLEIPGSPVPVWVSSDIASACLFGLFRPAVYLTPRCAADETQRRHVLTHELTHLRHWDHIWSFIRCICLCIYWFDRLVWLAAYLSRRDCELACDEAALKTLGDGERIAYGRTLVDMVAAAPSPVQLLETATAMHESKKQLKERVNCIVKKQKKLISAAIALTLLLALVTGCAFAGIGDSDPVSTDASGNLILSEKMELEIKQAFLKIHDPDGHYTADDLTVRFHGAFNGAYAVFVDGIYGFLTMITSETVEGVTFMYPSSQKMEIYFNGSFYSLQEAFDAKLLTLDDLIVLEENYPYNDLFDEATQPTPTTEVSEPTTIPTTPPRSEELLAWETLFSDPASWYYRALTCTYSSSQYLDIYEIFYDGLHFPKTDTPTAEERAELEKSNNYSNTNFSRLSVDELNAVLTEFFGTTLDQVDPAGLNGLVYLESTNSYCFFHGDTNMYADLYISHMEEAADSTVRLYYTHSHFDREHVVTVQPSGNGWIILSNLPA